MITCVSAGVGVRSQRVIPKWMMPHGLRQTGKAGLQTKAAAQPGGPAHTGRGTPRAPRRALRPGGACLIANENAPSAGAGAWRCARTPTSSASTSCGSCTRVPRASWNRSSAVRQAAGLRRCRCSSSCASATACLASFAVWMASARRVGVSAAGAARASALAARARRPVRPRSLSGCGQAPRQLASGRRC